MSTATTELSLDTQVTLSNHLPKIGQDTLVHRILSGLCAKQKHISSMFFYDATGSRLFEEITCLPEYYPTRIEKALLKTAARQINGLLSNIDIVELGSGDCSKISLLLEGADAQARHTIRYLPLDVSEPAIRNSVSILHMLYPEICIHGMAADFLSQLDIVPHGRRRLFCFFGSTIGNLSRTRARRFIRDLGGMMEAGDQLLLGLDRVKELQVLHAAYNDAQGITAAFNRNILNVVNALAGTDFNPEGFEHLAFYNSERSRIEMHLKAAQSMTVRCPHLKRSLHLFAGETIHTENSQKYTDDDITGLSRASGLTLLNQWTDAKRWFMLVQLGKT